MPATTDTPLATLLWRARQNAGLTLQQAADASGLSYMAVYRTERPGPPPSVRVLRTLARVYGCTLVITLEPREP